MNIIFSCSKKPTRIVQYSAQNKHSHRRITNDNVEKFVNPDVDVFLFNPGNNITKTDVYSQF